MTKPAKSKIYLISRTSPLYQRAIVVWETPLGEIYESTSFELTDHFNAIFKAKELINDTKTVWRKQEDTEFFWFINGDAPIFIFEENSKEPVCVYP